MKSYIVQRFPLVCDEKQNCFHSQRHDDERILISSLFPIFFSPSFSLTFPYIFFSLIPSLPFPSQITSSLFHLDPKEIREEPDGMTKRLATPNTRNIPTHRVIFPRQLTLRRAPISRACLLSQTDKHDADMSVFAFVCSVCCGVCVAMG